MADFIGGAAAGLPAGAATATPGSTGHYLRQMSPSGAETLGIHPKRLKTNRGNAYLPPVGLAELATNQNLIFPNWDCKNTSSGGPQPADTANPNNSPTSNGPACFIDPNLMFQRTTQAHFAFPQGESYRGR